MLFPREFLLQNHPLSLSRQKKCLFSCILYKGVIAFFPQNQRKSQKVAKSKAVEFVIRGSETIKGIIYPLFSYSDKTVKTKSYLISYLVSYSVISSVIGQPKRKPKNKSFLFSCQPKIASQR